jgi:hypothetical protein
VAVVVVPMAQPKQAVLVGLALLLFLTQIHLLWQPQQQVHLLKQTWAETLFIDGLEAGVLHSNGTFCAIK